MTLGEACVPKVTAVAPVKPVPLIVTLVPPAIGPLAGETALTVGADAAKARAGAKAPAARTASRRRQPRPR